MNNRLYDKQYWLNIRKQTEVDGWDGKDKCINWCVAAARKANEDFPNILLAGISYREKDNWTAHNPRTWFHQWIESHQEGRRFIADGTAGQHDPVFSEGFYDFAYNASPLLRKVYFGEHVMASRMEFVWCLTRNSPGLDIS